MNHIGNVIKEYRSLIGMSRNDIAKNIYLDETDEKGNKYEYRVDEKEVPANYTKSISGDGLTVTNTYTSPKTEVTGTKAWVGGPTSKPSIELQLYRNGEALAGEVVALDGIVDEIEETPWVYTWNNLDKTDITGVDYKYTVDEVDTPNDYGKSVSTDGLTVMNTYKSPKTDIIGRKVWEGGEFNRPDSIQLQLYRQIEGGEKVAVGSPVTLAKRTYEYNWKDQDINDSNANKYTYTVEEIGTPINYTKSENDLEVTNTYVIPKTSITGTKEWIGGSSTKPTIQLQLYRDALEYDDPVTLEDGTASYTWENLDETDANGKAYVYTIDEVETPSGYRKTISEDGLTITNRYNPSSGGGGGGKDPKDSEKPETPPETPEIPQIPVDPETPIIPEIPIVPETPITQEVPPTPYTPGRPITPEEYELLYGETPQGVPNRPITPEEYEQLYGKIPEAVPAPTLPKTGSSSNIALILLGFMLVISGVLLKKKRTE